MRPVKQKLKMEFAKNHSIAELLGERDKYIKKIEQDFNVDIFVLGNDVEITGQKKNVEHAANLLNELTLQINIGQKINSDSLRYS